MNNDQLQTILRQYPMSLRLDIIVEGERMLETTVVELLLKLMEQPQSALVTFCGRSCVIVRERGFNSGLPPYKPWLEMDMR